MAQKPYILGMGNPLLDISSPVEKSFIEKYKVPLGSACLAEAEHLPMYNELTEMKTVEYIAGGATLNAIRVAQWKLGDLGQSGYMGAIGKDAYGGIMQEQCRANGVEACFMVNDEVPTGTCAVAILEKERGLVANLAAANTYKKTHFDENSRMCMKADIVYSAGFFLTVSADSMLESAKMTEATGSLYAINLAAPFISQVFKKPLLDVMAFADLVFGNEEEATAFGKSMEWTDTTPVGVVKAIANMKCSKSGGSRMAIITQGADKTLVARSDGLYMEIPVEKIDKAKIVDTNAAGDAFVGGYLAALALGKSVEDCVKCGQKTAAYIIQRSGCTTEGKSESRLVC